MNVNVEIDNKNVTKIFRQLERKIADASSAMKKITEVVVDESQRNFGQQGALYQGGGFFRPGGALANLGRATTRGRSWQPLAVSTRRSRVRRGFPAARPILENTGDLKGGFKSRFGKKFAEVWNKIDYAKYHQFGTDRMPARRVLGLTKKSWAAMKQIVINHILR